MILADEFSNRGLFIRLEVFSCIETVVVDVVIVVKVVVDVVVIGVVIVEVGVDANLGDVVVVIADKSVVSSVSEVENFDLFCSLSK